MRPPLALGFGAGFSSSFWSPMTDLTGQNEKIGHFLQPTARAMGQRVMRELLGSGTRPRGSLHQAPGQRASQRQRGASAPGSALTTRVVFFVVAVPKTPAGDIRVGAEGMAPSGLARR